MACVHFQVNLKNACKCVLSQLHGPESHQELQCTSRVSSPFMVPGSKQQIGDGPGRLKEEGAKCHQGMLVAPQEFRRTRAEGN